MKIIDLLVIICLFFNSVVILKAQNSQIYNKLDESFYAANYLDVIRCAGSILKEDSLNTEVMYKQYIAYQSVQQNDKAKKCLLHAIKISPENQKYLFALARFYFDNGKPKQSEEILLKLYESDSMNFNTNLYLTNIYTQSDRNREAFPLFLKLIKIDSTNTFVTNRLGICYLKLGETRTSINLYKKTIQQNPEYLNSYKMLGIIYTGLNQYDSAMMYVNMALKIDSMDIDCYKRRGDINFSKNYHFRCIPDYLKVFNSGDSSKYILEHLATNYYVGRMYKEALPFLIKVWKMDSSRTDIASNIADTYTQLNDFSTGEIWYKKAIGISKLQIFYAAIIYQRLAKEYEIRGRYSDAVANFNRYVDLSQDYNYILHIATLFDEKLNNKILAIENYEKFIEKVQNDTYYPKETIDATKKRMEWLRKNK